MSAIASEENDIWNDDEKIFLTSIRMSIEIMSKCLV